MSVFWGTSSLAVESLPDIPMTLSSITRQEGKKKNKQKRGEKSILPLCLQMKLSLALTSALYYFRFLAPRTEREQISF